MGHWGEWIPQLREVCSLLRWRHSRERLVATCFGDGPAAPFAHLLTAFAGQVYEGRWGSVVEAVRALEVLEAPLRAGWGQQKYCFGKGAAPEAPDEDGE
eukprot:8809622-Alexandrium_andersonii.AAC.1